VLDKQQSSVQVIDIAVPSDSNVSMKEREKIEKYKDLSVELSALWKVKCEIIPLVIGCLGCASNMQESYLQRLTIAKFCNLELLQ